MRNYPRFSVSLVLSLLFVAGCSSVPRAQTPLTTLQGKQGGTIVYGLVGGASTPASAMAHLLRMVQNNYGDKPQVGKVFRVRGSNSDAVFFTVTNRAQGNQTVAGEVIATPTGPQTVEAALVSDSAARFGTTMNPLLNQLFGVWHPGGGGAAGGGKSAPAEPLHQVWNQDHSALVGIPDGWKVQGNGGTTLVIEGNYNAMINLNLVRGATANPNYRPYGGMTTGMGVKMVYPANWDPARGFPGFLKEFYRVNNQRIDFRIAQTEQMAGPPGLRCVHAVGHGLLFGATQPPPPNITEKDYWEMDVLGCMTAPNRMGDYTVTLSISEIDPRFADHYRATIAAILQSYQVNQAVVSGEANAIAAPVIANIHRIGAEATQRMRDNDIRNDQQHSDWRAGEEKIARQTQGFSNYILDQTVVQDNNMYGNGTIGHGTLWNNEADALVKHDPKRFEYVTEPNYWRGTDFVP
jgi:citrate lyase gamma subunit